MDYLNGYIPKRATREKRGIVPWLSLLGMGAIWIGPFLVLTFIISLVAHFIFIPLYLGWFATPLLTGFVVYAVYRIVMDARRRNGRIIVGYLDMAVRLNLPLEPFLRAAARSETGRRARQITHIQHALASGAPVSSALVDAVDVPDDVVQRLEASEPLGQLRQALGRTITDEKRVDDETAGTPDAMLFRFYPIFMFFMIFTLLTFLMIFVVPKFREIFKDFRTTLPLLTQFVIGISSAMEDYWPLTLLLIFLIVCSALLLTSVLMSRVFLPFMPMPAFSRIGDWLAWRLPFLHTLQRDRAMAETCALLAAAQRGNVPLPDALGHAQRLPMNEGFRQRVARFRDQLIAGQAPADAARQAELPDLLAGLLASSSGRADGDLYTFLERYYRNRFSRTVLLIRGAAEPLIVLTFATLVGFTVLALFLPLVKLIQSVSGGSDGGTL